MSIRRNRRQVASPGEVPKLRVGGTEGFSLAEMLIATLVLTFGLLAVGQLLFVAMSSSSLGRSKSSATVVAQNKIEFLAERFRMNPLSPEFNNGNYGPDIVQVTNPLDNTALNRYRVTWNVVTVPDPRMGMLLRAKRVTVTATPINAATQANRKTSMNKVASFTAIFSPRY